MGTRGKRAGKCAAKLRVALGAALLLAAGSAGAQTFKCGSTFQDRPCEAAAVQQRFSHTRGTFAIQQVNPNTDHECAKVAAEAIAWWDRISAGEPLEKLHGEIQQMKISRYDKSMLRDLLTAVNGHRGTSVEVRSQFESQCMAFKRTPPAAREAPGRSTPSGESYYEAELRRVETEHRRADAESRRMEAQRRRAEIEAQRAARARLP